MSSAGEHFAPGRLWSLWEMLGKYAAAYIVIVESIDRMVTNLDMIALLPAQDDGGTYTLAALARESALDKETGDHIKDALESIVVHTTKRMALPSVVAQVKRLQHAIDRQGGAAEIRALLKELRTRLIDELIEREFIYVQPERAKFYKDPMLFGKNVNDRFPLAIDDIEEAGKCLALGRGTACVLHTMRVLEVGLKALAKALNIPYAPSWESYLKQIATNIGMERKKKTKKWLRDEKFYRDLSGDLLTVKQAWRNPTMHVDRKYSEEEAEQIFSAANALMNRLASHFSAKEIGKMIQ